MRNTGYNLAGYGANFPLIEDKGASSAFAEEEISQEDLQLIDSFAGLQKAERQIVLDMVRHMLHKESESLPE